MNGPDTGIRRLTLASPKSDTEPRLRRFLLIYISVLVSLSLAMWWVGFTAFSVYYVIAFLWFLVLSVLLVSPKADMRWTHGLRWAKWLGWILLVYVLFRRVMPVLS
ncbi:hypothetical protein BVU17_16905 [Haloarcula taiwanensis]|uniref:Uncharacterized protein n=1 Tax=Haloarcula taiwanensis TaxID=1932004 RepID=A0A2H5A3B9_9EURY|nr:hypothetical protein BVU17_16905 [Haloarcula taiwanensis]RLM34613.1 hypothetical protein DVK01_13055 [Haloarcula sp. Atlit-120R]RLM44027.1 hypothetical protein DVK00_13250 [Haloarcula sp. Atlit-47R]